MIEAKLALLTLENKQKPGGNIYGAMLLANTQENIIIQHAFQISIYLLLFSFILGVIACYFRFLKRFTYLDSRTIDKETGRQGELPSAGLFLQWLPKAGTRPSQSQELGTLSMTPMQVAGTMQLSHHLLLPGCISKVPNWQAVT